MYLLAFVCSPLAVLFSGKWFQAIINGGLYWLSCYIWYLFWPAWILAWPGAMFFWFLGFLHACIVIHGTKADKRNDRLVAAMKANKGSIA